MKHKFHYNSPIGIICIEEDEGFITQLYIENAEYNDDDEHETETLKKAHAELQEYFERKRKNFDLKIKPEGTEFQKKVWAALTTIPYGKTLSYGDIAKLIGNPKASRAVGGANNKNPIMIIVPCHRVIGSNGALVGFGAGIEVKKYLLNLEKE